MDIKIRRQNALWLLALSVLGLMVMPAMVQAKPSYVTNGAKLTETETTWGSGAAISISIPTLSTTVECKKQTGTGIISPNGTSEDSKTLSTCSVIGLPCQVAAPITVASKGRIIEHKNQVYVVYEPQGKAFTVLKFSGEKCSLPGELEVSGTIIALAGPKEAILFPFSSSSENTELICKFVSPCKFKVGSSEAILSGVYKEWIEEKEEEVVKWGAVNLAEFAILGLELSHYEGKESISIKGGLFQFNALEAYEFLATCQEASGTGTIEVFGRGSVNITFTKCEFEILGKKWPHCGMGPVTMEAQFLAQPHEMESSAFIFSPITESEEEVLIKLPIKNELEMCALGEGSYIMRGSTVARVAEKGEKTTHGLSFSKAIIGEFPEYGLTFGAGAAYIEGGFAVSLSGEHLPCAWGVI